MIRAAALTLAATLGYLAGIATMTPRCGRQGCCGPDKENAVTETNEPAAEMVERVARALAIAGGDEDLYEDAGDVDSNLSLEEDRDWYRKQARAAIAALAPELNQAELTVRALALLLRDEKDAGRDKVDVGKVEETIADPARVVMKR